MREADNNGAAENEIILIGDLYEVMAVFDSLKPVERMLLAQCKRKVCPIDYASAQANDPTTLQYLFTIRSPDFPPPRRVLLAEQQRLDRLAISLMRRSLRPRRPFRR